MPVARSNESLRERIMVIARNSGLAVHHVTVHDLGGKLIVGIDLEVDGNMSLTAAHNIAHDLERSIRNDFGEDVDQLEVENIEEEIKELTEAKKEVYLEAKGNGFDVKILREVIRVRKQDQKEREATVTCRGLHAGNKGHFLGCEGCLRRRGAGFYQESWRPLYVNSSKNPRWARFQAERACFAVAPGAS